MPMALVRRSRASTSPVSESVITLGMTATGVLPEETNLATASGAAWMISSGT